MTQFRSLIEALVAAEVEFLVVGGLAAAAHGSTRVTQDIDIVYSRTSANLDRLVRALAPLHPYHGLGFRSPQEVIDDLIR